MFGRRGTLLTSSALYGLAALGGMAGAQHALAQSMTLVQNGVTNASFTNIKTAIASVTGPGYTLTVNPGPTAVAVGTIAVGATSAVLASNPYSVGQVVVFGSLNSSGVFVNGLSPSIPFRDKIIAVSGNTITWTIPAFQSAVSPIVSYDYSDGGIDPDFGGTITCSVTHACHLIPIAPIASGGGIFRLGSLGENPGGEKVGGTLVGSMVINGFDIEGGTNKVNAKQTACFTPNDPNSNSEVGLTYCPGMLVPGGGDCVFYVNADNVVLTNNIMEWCTDAYLADPTVQGYGNLTISNNLVQFNGDNGGQTHNLYIGRNGNVVVSNNTVAMSWGGNDIKIRSVKGTIANNTVGSAGVVMANGSLVLDHSNNQIQVPDVGAIVVTGNTLYTGPAANNTTPVEYEGVVMSWPNPSLLFSGNTLTLDTAGESVDFVWNGEPFGATAVGGTCQVDVRNNVFLTVGTSAVPPIFIGAGCQSGNTLNGTIVSGTTNTTYALGSPNAPNTICDFNSGPTPCAAATAPYTIVQDFSTITKPILILGDPSHFTSVTDTEQQPLWGSINILFGNAGGSYTGNGAIVFSPASATAASRITLGGFGESVQSYFLSGPNDVISETNVTPRAGGYLEAGAPGLQYIGCAITAGAPLKSCGYLIEQKSSVAGRIPSSTFTGNGGGLGDKFKMISGGTMVFKGPWDAVGGFNMACSSDTVICGSTYGVEIFDPASFSQKGVPYGGTIVGTATQGTPNVWTDAGYPGFMNYYYNLNGSGWSMFARNATIWFGNGSGAAITAINNPAEILDSIAIIPGSGGGTYGTQPNAPGMIEVINGQGGGTVNVTNYNNARAATIPVVSVGYTGASYNATQSGNTATLTFVDGSVVNLSPFTGTINTTPPLANSLTLTVPASQSIAAGATVAIAGITIADPNGLDYAGMDELIETVSSGTLVPGGQFASFATVTPDGHTLTMLGGLRMVNSLLANQTYIATSTNDLLTVNYFDQFGYNAASTDNLVITSATSADLRITGPASLTITPGSSISINDVLSDPWAAGQAGTLTAKVTDQSRSKLILHGVTTTTGTVTAGLSYAAMVTALSTLGYVNNNAATDQITVAVTNQGGFSGTLVSNVQTNPAVDLTLNLPSTESATAGISDALAGTLAPSITDSWAAANGVTVTVMESTDYGSLVINGNTFGAGQTATIASTVGNVNAILAGETYLAPLSGSANVSLNATNSNGGTATGSFVIGVTAQGSSTDMIVVAPTAVSVPTNGSVVVQGISVNSPWSNTTPGALSLKLADQFDTIVFAGSTIAAGTTGTFLNDLSGLNAALAGLAIVTPGTANCDYLVVTPDNQASFSQSNTITVTTVGNALTLTAPASRSVAAGATAALTGGNLAETIPALTTLTITDTLGDLVIQSQNVPAPVSRSFIGDISTLAAIMGGIVYQAPAASGTDVLSFSAVDQNGVATSTVHTTITVTGTSGCPLP